IRRADVAVVTAVRRTRNAGARHAGVAGRARVAVVAGRAVRHRHAHACTGRWIALAGLMALVDRGAHDRRSARARPGLPRAVVLRARAGVVAGSTLVGRHAVARAASRVADLGRARVRVLRAGHRPGPARTGSLAHHAVVHGTGVVIVAGRIADGG